MDKNYNIYNQSCIEGMQEHIEDNSIDLIFTDPPYGIEMDGKGTIVHQAREQAHVVPGYVDVPINEYAEFSYDWIAEAARCLRPGGSIYIVSGYTGLHHILNALHATNLQEINHIIAHYSFGVSTRTKWVSSHYHVLYWAKPPLKTRTFNTFCRYSDMGDSYHDRLTVQPMQRDYKPKELKNANQLSESFIEKFLFYSSNRGDVVMDPFCGGFTAARTALRYGRKFIGFELNNNAVEAFLPGLDLVLEMDDPTPIDPSPEEMKKRKKKREGYKRAAERRKAKNQK